MNNTFIPSAKELLEKHTSITSSISAKEHAIISSAINTLDKHIRDGYGEYSWCKVALVSDFNPKMQKYIRSLGYDVRQYVNYIACINTSVSGIEIRILPSITEDSTS